MKKTLALILAFALVFSTMTVAFAEDVEIGADAKVCADLGMLVGDGSGVTPAYLATTPTRIQAAIMFLRLKGLEQEALAFAGTENFADGNIAWAEGKNLLAYLKANPQLGWIGDGTNFNPNEPITAQQYAKVMLEALGYKQTTAEVVGDFTFDGVAEFAASKGLTVAEGTFTVNELAAATVGALKATVKDGGKTLIATLVEAGKIDAAKVAAAGLGGATTTDSEVDYIKAIGNSTVLITFKDAVEKSFAENAANFVIEGLEVQSAVLDGTSQILLTTAAMTAGKTYKLTIGEAAYNFGGVSKDSVAPEIDEVKGSDTDRVKVTFTKSMDLTALDMANYSIAGVTINSAAWNDDEQRDEVVLVTSGMTVGKTYKLVVSNVQSVDGVVMKSDSENFTAKSDKAAPKINKSDTKVQTNERILVAFTDDNELTKESAENLANWKITVGSGSDTLEITAAKLVENDDDDLLNVELTTASQKSGQKYVVHVSNLVDTSALANKMTNEATVDIHGKKADTTNPKMSDVNYVSEDTIKVNFTDDSRMDQASLTDINNYTISNDVSINNVALTKDDADCKSVLVKVSGLEDGKSYKVTVSNIADEFGNKIDSAYKSKKYNEADAAKRAYIRSVKVNSNTELELTFSKDLDETTAEDRANYSVSGSIGTPKKASLNDAGDVVTLTVSSMSNNTTYTITVNGVLDEAGNELVNVTAKILNAPDDMDTERPGIDNVEAINKYAIRITYDEPINHGTGQYAYIDTDNNGVADLVGDPVVSADDDDYEVEYQLYRVTNYDPNTKAYTIATSPTAITDNDPEDAVLLNVLAEDYAGNVCDDADYDFTLTTDANDDIEIASWEQVSPKEFKVEFTEKVAIRVNPTDTTFQDNAFAPVSVNGSWVKESRGYSFKVAQDKDDAHVIRLTTTGATLKEDKEIEFYFHKFVVNYYGCEVLDETEEGSGPSQYYTVLTTDAEDEDGPYIENVEVVDRQTINVTFNEELSSAGAYRLAYVNKDGKDSTLNVSPKIYEREENNVVVLTVTNGKLEGRYSYDLIPTAKAKDVKGNSADWTVGKDADELASFEGTDTEKVPNYIAGIKFYEGSYIRPRFYSKLSNLDSVSTSIYYSNENTSGELSTALYTAAPKKDYGPDTYAYQYNFNIKMATGISGYNIPLFAFAKDTDYTVNIGTMRYTFEGIVDHDITKDDVTRDGRDFTVTYSDVEDGDIVAFIKGNAVVGWSKASTTIGGAVVTVAAGESLDAGYAVNIIVVRDANDSKNTAVRQFSQGVVLIPVPES